MPARSTDPARRSALWNISGWLVLNCALVTAGCANWQMPRLDPTGEHILIPAGAPDPAFPPGATMLAPPVGPTAGLVINPSSLIAPVGSEVVLVGSVIGGEGYLLTNEVVEWTLDPGGVGQFLTAGQRRRLDLLNWWRGLPRKVDSRYAINATLRYPLTLDRGTPNPGDDLIVQTGQSYVTVISPVEGKSLVTAFAPAISGWELRQQTATIYWVDAQWQFPAPAISPPGGRNALITTLNRQTDNSPLAGWQIRYEIAGGPPAGFAPDGATSAIAITNDAGQASVEIMQSQATPGTNQVNISVIRPAGVGGQTAPLTVGVGATSQTWAAAGAPPMTGMPQPIPGTAPPPTLEQPPVAQPNPAAQPSPVASPQAALDVAITGPTSANVGDRVQFQIRLANRGSAVASNLQVTDRFDAGLRHAIGQDTIQQPVIDLQPGGIAQLTVNLEVGEAGTLCQNVEVTSGGAPVGSARHCLTASAAPIAAPAPDEQRWEPEPSGVPTTPFPATPEPSGPSPTPAEPTQPPPTTPADAPPSQPAQPSTAGTPSLTVRMTGPDRKQSGEQAVFAIEVTNTGTGPAEDVVIADNFETSLEPSAATEGNEWLEGNALGWRIGTLAAGQTVRRSIQLKCLQVTPRACNRVTVTARAIEPVAEEACLEIVAAPAAPAAGPASPQAPVSVTVAETTDPVRVSGTTTYQILVENKDSQSVYDVVISAKLSPELKLETIAGPVGTDGQVQANSVKFVPVRELRAGEAPLNFELHVTGVQAGAGTVDVEVTTRGGAAPVTATQQTQVVN
jgi:uncharacterized repeat protein (TIGR01451 family)